MKYRRLNAEELQALEQEFIQYLAANTITGAEWESMKKNDAKKAEEQIQNFSDIVMQKVLEGLEFLEKVSPKEWLMFHCQKDKISLLGLKTAAESELDFTKHKLTPEILSELDLYTAEKDYDTDREVVIFKMMENGAFHSDGKFYKSLKQAIVDK